MLFNPDAGRGRACGSFGLTPREREVIAAVVAGYTNKNIAQKFSMDEHTVKHHVANVFDKLRVSNRLELALFAVEHQLCRRQGQLRPSLRGASYEWQERKHPLQF